MRRDDHLPSLSDWTPDAGIAPLVRVGVVLAEDGDERLTVRLPSEDYTLTSEDGGDVPLSATRVVFVRREGGVAARVADGDERRATTWRLAPTKSMALAAGHGLTVADVRTGRGFHWQKRLDQTLPGALEISAGAGGLSAVNLVGLEDYLACVATSEMSGACPAEFLKAQTVVARSWLLAFSERKHDDDPFDRCNDDCCQRYHGTQGLTDAAQNAIAATHGAALLTSDGRPVDANYSKCCGGVAENPVHVWNVSKAGLAEFVDAPPGSSAHRFLPVTEANVEAYLSGAWLADTDVYCSPTVVPPAELERWLGRADDPGAYFRWDTTLARADLEQRVRAGVAEAADLTELLEMQAVTRGVSGRISRLRVGFKNGGGAESTADVAGELAIRQLLDVGTLFSSAFRVTPQRDADGRVRAFHLRGAGWGHGVGFCQIGGLGMALQGKTCDEILRHYFPQARVAAVYDRA